MYQTLQAGKFTPRQLAVLRSVQPGDIVRDVRVLRKLSLLGVVTLHEHTGEIVKHVWGMPVRAAYIDEAETFGVEGVGTFHRKYFDGCFCPFLIKARMDEKGGIRY